MDKFEFVKVINKTVILACVNDCNNLVKIEDNTEQIYLQKVKF